jgi:hypothetical protein
MPPCPMRVTRLWEAVSVLGETPGTDPDASGMRYQHQTTICCGALAQRLPHLVAFTRLHVSEPLYGAT